MKSKLKLSFVLSLVATLFVVTVSAQIKTPQPSPAGSVSAEVGLTTVTIDYFRPGVKGRTIFGDDALLPYGSIWRTGANSGSKITFSTDVKLGGKDVGAGEYMIYTVPGADSWDFMLYSDLKLGGNVGGYDETNEVIRVSVTPETLANSVERLTFNIADISADNTKANIRMMWENTAINVPMEVAFDETIMADIAAKTQVNPRNYISAANYYYSTGKDLNKALEWVNLYLAVGENSKQFWNVHLKAKILADLGKKKEAIAAAEESMATAKANESGDFGYVKRNEDLIAELKKKK
jgi:hypothetical protein